MHFMCIINEKEEIMKSIMKFMSLLAILETELVKEIKKNFVQRGKSYKQLLFFNWATL